MCSYAIDLWTDRTDLLVDEAAMLTILRDAATAGHAVVVGSLSHEFPNGAITAVVLLSQSHLSVHTWPEFKLANIDLLTCGPLNADLMVAHLKTELAPTKIHVTATTRDVTT
jgi:S-adenosylmethionine decarboxylase